MKTDAKSNICRLHKILYWLNLKTANNSDAWVLAYKSNTRIPIFNKPVLLYLTKGFVFAEYELPDNIPNYSHINISNNIILLHNQFQSSALNKALQLIGSQNSLEVLDNLTLLNDFVVKNSYGFHTSSDGLSLKSRINGLPAGTEILHSRDSFFYISSDLGYSTFNAITGQEVRRFDFKNEKMPISMDSAYVVDYYSTRNGISYLVTNKGIVVAK